MARWANLIAVIAVAALVAIGCADGGGGNPLTPSSNHELKSESSHTGPTHTQLWGYYDVYLDIENRTVEIIPNRRVMYAVNVVRFINEPPTNLGFQIHDIVQGSNYVDIDIDITITHPFPGMPQFNGYDVRGVFIGDGSSTLDYNNSLAYPVFGTDQYMLDDPLNGDGGGPDGYTRWYNPVEFTTEGMFGYTPGALQSQNFDGNATLCPYRYFADGLGANDDVWEFLTSTANNGVFTSGAVNSRNYYLRFPATKGVQYGYAIVADWEGPDVHPSNAAEAVACKVIDSSDIFYIDPATYGGNLILDISLFGWDYQPSTIYIESTVLSNVVSFDPSTIATGGGDHYSTYHVEIPADNITMTEGNEYWVIAEYEEFDYSNIIGVPNEAESDYLSAFFRYDLSVEPYNFGWARTWAESESSSQGWGVATDVSGNVYVTGWFSGTVDFDPDGGDPHTSNGSGDVFLSKFNSMGNFEWARNWGGFMALGCSVATDSSGNVYVTGYFHNGVDFDPDGGDIHHSNGQQDVFLSKFDSSGNFVWAQTWGGSGRDEGWGVAVDDSGNVYVTGYFEDIVDFDPDGGDPHTSIGTSDVFLSKFSTSGSFQWARTWGGSHGERVFGAATDNSGNVYVTGNFRDTVDFDPDGGDPHTSNGSDDVFLSKFDASGNFKWARTWGGAYVDAGHGVSADGSGNCYVTGCFRGTVDFDPDGGDPHTSGDSWDVFLSKFDSSGNFDWARTWGGPLYWHWANKGGGVTADGYGNVYVTGHFMGIVDFDPDGGDLHTSNGSGDVFLSRFDSSGNFEWAQTWGGPSLLVKDVGQGVAVDGSGNVFVTGYFADTVDFAPTDPPCSEIPDEHFSNGPLDGFLTKHLPDGCW